VENLSHSSPDGLIKTFSNRFVCAADEGSFPGATRLSRAGFSQNITSALQ
jgi:hypothetical protein